MTLAIPSRRNPHVALRVIAWIIAIVSWANWLAFAGGAATVFLGVGVLCALIAEALFWTAAFRRAFSPWKPATRPIRFAKSD